MVMVHTVFGSLIAGYRMASQWNTDYSLLNFEDKERKVYEYAPNTFLKEYSMWLRRAKKKHGRKSCKIVDWSWVEAFTAPCPMMR